MGKRTGKEMEEKTAKRAKLAMGIKTGGETAK